MVIDVEMVEEKFDAKEYRRNGKTMLIGQNRFGEKGIRLVIKTPELKIKGKLAFGPLSPLKYDIMGPFALLPFMECRHEVWSMKLAFETDKASFEYEYPS